MIQLTAEEYETLLRDARRYRAQRTIVCNPALSAQVLAELETRWLAANPVSPELYDEIVDLGIELAKADLPPELFE